MEIEIPQQYKSLKYERGIEWRDIFAVWRANEAYQKEWQEHWLGRGFESWDDWRENYFAALEPELCSWEVYRIKNTSEDVALMWGVPSRGWQEKCYAGETTKMIGDILNHPMVAENSKVKSIMNNFPHQTMLTGIVNEGRIILIEGMHRTLALAQMKVDKEGVIIALANYKGELPSIGRGNIIV